ncbi:hypothetical protein LIER_21850 [Lithospermum erythrorhizon]|uniref:Uncharacterized protein n=1 Tax=Lithospermum erythrorhizon TaxID=34254 RepID=A0AAV3QU11_LITER
MLEAHDNSYDSRQQLTTTRKGIIWFDKVSAMSIGTFNLCDLNSQRNNAILVELLADLHPGSIRFGYPHLPVWVFSNFNYFTSSLAVHNELSIYF